MDILTTAMDLIDLTTTYPDDDYSGPNNTGNYSNYEDEWIPNADEIPYLINVTRDVPIKYAMPLFGYMMPLLLLITLIANTLIVIVLAQKHMRNSN
ncbi:sex peptide receptor [Trichonephila clavata]|uniref:Sex peptide receptor n=1 Tax=Trichonephila clavata TaxID=2740835 RepID=A0A8X6FPE1_TRICU|nr:sex peptide receptor [Trichonephila clavata]